MDVTPTPGPDPALLPVLAAAAGAQDGFDGELIGAFPPPGLPKLHKLHTRHIPGRVVQHLAALLYMLEAHRVTTSEAMATLVDAHNERMEELRADVARNRRLGINAQRFADGVFSEGERRNAVADIALAGGLAMNGKTIARLLAPQADRQTVADLLSVLRDAGAFRTERGAYNSLVHVSDGRLEAMYGRYLAALRDGVRCAAP